MDGSSKGSKPKPPKPAAKSARPAQPAAGASRPAGAPKPKADDDDPFGLTQSTTARRVIPCARKPVKGRTYRVQCPMCETVGFVPKSAVGKQVKCANPECLVPLFTVPNPDTSATERAPARVSEAALVREEQLAKPKGKQNPLVKYGIIGGIGLALALGLVAFLNSSGQVDPNLDRPVDLSQLQFDDGDSEETPEAAVQDSPDTSAAASTDFAAEAKKLTIAMIDAARQPANNRDKPYCRRLTGDAFLRLNMPQEAASEFLQLRQISRDATYYTIEPYLRQYWNALAAGDRAAADAYLADAKAEGDRIPPTGRLGLQAGIALAAALVNENDVPTAIARIEVQQRDQTVTAQLDDVRHGAWFAAASAMRGADLQTMSPVSVFAWNEPLKTSVAVHLAVHGRWQQVTDWAKSQPRQATASDILAVAAGIAVQLQASEDSATLLHEAASAIDPMIGLRTAAVLGRSDQNKALWDAATAQAASLAAQQTADMPDLATVVRMDPPNISGVHLQAQALAAVAGTAALKQNSELAVSAIQKLHNLLTSEVPPTADVRRAVRMLETEERSLMQQLQDRFALGSDAEVKAQFRNYRRGLDRLAAAAEDRRLLFVQLLNDVVRSQGASAVQAAMAANDRAIQRELAVDGLSMILAAAAIQTGQQLPELARPDEALLVPVGERTEDLPEIALAPLVLAATQAISNAAYPNAIQALEAGRTLPGFLACEMNDLIAHAAQQATQVPALLEGIQSAQNPLWREDGMHVAARVLTERREKKAIDAWLTEAKQSATERVLTLHGIVTALADMQPAAPADG